MVVKVFAPVNIAWIKYMGKIEGKATNSSLSMTLDRLGTQTEMTFDEASLPSALRFAWDERAYVPPTSGVHKAETFLLDLERFREVLRAVGIKAQVPQATVNILTQNTVPASSGIATSASGFAALTLAWLGILAGSDFEKWKKEFDRSETLRSQVAKLASLGSGSAGRSFDGPFVEWDPSREPFFKKVECPFLYTDFILVSDPSPKTVSSSEAHLRVQTSPLFTGRAERASKRLDDIYQAFHHENTASLPRLVREEAFDMHELFHTSVPSFRYWNANSELWIERITSGNSSLPSQNAILTLDAGSTVHLFVPEAEELIWEEYFAKLKLHYYQSRAGKGAHYVDSGH